MVGTRESQHFEVDVWPDPSRRSEAMVRIPARARRAGDGGGAVGRARTTRFAWNRTSELADLPLWMIHVAWPVAGVTWIVFAGEQIVDEMRILLGAKQ
jgi:hypothetical protein